MQNESSVSNSAALLSALQYADSFFPGGGITLSWGLEQLRTDGELNTSQDLIAFVEGQLLQRWAIFDAPALSAAWRADEDFERLCVVDTTLEAMTLAMELREGSRRAGAALLNVHARLGNSAAKRFRSSVLDAATPGHLAVVQGLVWRQHGVPEATCRAIAAHLLVTGFVSAALRLGLVGHLQAQAAIGQSRGLLSEILERPVPDFDEISAFTPATDIASMRHEQADARLFAN